jgi:hypothetical protein
MEIVEPHKNIRKNIYTEFAEFAEGTETSRRKSSSNVARSAKNPWAGNRIAGFGD